MLSTVLRNTAKLFLQPIVIVVIMNLVRKGRLEIVLKILRSIGTKQDFFDICVIIAILSSCGEVFRVKEDRRCLSDR